MELWNMHMPFLMGMAETADCACGITLAMTSLGWWGDVRKWLAQWNNYWEERSTTTTLSSWWRRLELGVPLSGTRTMGKHESHLQRHCYSPILHKSYWYKNGCLYPDMGTVFIAIDKCNLENGCLKVCGIDLWTKSISNVQSCRYWKVPTDVEELIMSELEDRREQIWKESSKSKRSVSNGQGL